LKVGTLDIQMFRNCDELD